MKTSKLRVTGLCVGNSLGTGEFPAQMASNAENDSIWWRHHGKAKGWPLKDDDHKSNVITTGTAAPTGAQQQL